MLQCTVFPTCQVGLGISVSCTTPVRRKLFPSAPQPLVGLKDLLHLKQTHTHSQAKRYTDATLNPQVTVFVLEKKGRPN